MKISFNTALLGAALCAGLVLAPAARADEFTICPSGVSGVATDETSCAFADNVRAAWNAQPSSVVSAYSPVTQQSVTLDCTAVVTESWPQAMRCTGANSSGVTVVVYFSTPSPTQSSGSGSQPGTGPGQSFQPAPPVAVDADSPDLPGFDAPNVGCTWVNGYMRSNGTYVSGYLRC